MARLDIIVETLFQYIPCLCMHFYAMEVNKSQLNRNTRGHDFSRSAERMLGSVAFCYHVCVYDFYQGGIFP